VSEVVEEARARCCTAVAGVLASRRHPTDLPADPERLLESLTYGGFTASWSYTAFDAVPE
jgi:methylmalonyl-CoA mutase